MRILLVALIAGILSACGPGKKPDEQAFLSGLDSAKNSTSTIDEEVIGSILQQIPSPLEISVLLKESGTKYNSTILNTSIPNER